MMEKINFEVNDEKKIVNSASLKTNYVWSLVEACGGKMENNLMNFSNLLKKYDFNGDLNEFETNLNVLTKTERERFVIILNDEIFGKVKHLKNIEKEGDSNNGVKKKGLIEEIKKLIVVSACIVSSGSVGVGCASKMTLEEAFILNPKLGKNIDQGWVLKAVKNTLKGASSLEYDFKKNNIDRVLIDKDLPEKARKEMLDFFDHFVYLNDEGLVINVKDEVIKVDKNNFEQAANKIIELTGGSGKYFDEAMKQIEEQNIKNFGNLKINEKGELKGDCEDFMMKVIEVAAKYDVRIFGLLGKAYIDSGKGTNHALALELENKERLSGKDRTSQEKEYFKVGDMYIYRCSSVNEGRLVIESIEGNEIEGTLSFYVDGDGNPVNWECGVLVKTEFKIEVETII